jgi:protein TIF31
MCSRIGEIGITWCGSNQIQDITSTITTLNTFTFHTDTTSSRKREAVRECVRNITFSAWNPPPGNRRLRGDLLYLEVSTLEGNQLHITSSVDGFFVNQSSSVRFDPSAAESSYKSHTLVDLLKKASPRFSSQFSALINRRVTSHPFENIDVARPIVPWLAPVSSHTFDWNRAEDALLSTFGMDSRGVLRDW